jgi:hypothetical protein
VIDVFGQLEGRTFRVAHPRHRVVAAPEQKKNLLPTKKNLEENWKRFISWSQSYDRELQRRRCKFLQLHW